MSTDLAAVPALVAERVVVSSHPVLPDAEQAVGRLVESGCRGR